MTFKDQGHFKRIKDIQRIKRTFKDQGPPRIKRTFKDQKDIQGHSRIKVKDLSRTFRPFKGLSGPTAIITTNVNVIKGFYVHTLGKCFSLKRENLIKTYIFSFSFFAVIMLLPYTQASYLCLLYTSPSPRDRG